MDTFSEWSTTTFLAARPYEDRSMVGPDFLFPLALAILVAVSTLAVRASRERRKWFARAALTVFVLAAEASVLDLGLRTWRYSPGSTLFAVVGATTTALLVALVFEWSVTVLRQR